MNFGLISRQDLLSSAWNTFT